MHIQERTNTTLTTCTKMTEEVDRRHGVNGNSSSKSVSEDVPEHGSAHTSTGGRLKFFKDGKFILELVRGCARSGARAGWVSVPRKTFWPPALPAAPPTPPAHAHTPTHERAELSVSDDNSSIQSSPWQRDHCWKQSNPRRNISKELALYYCRPNTLLDSAIISGSRSKRRRPYDATCAETLVNGSRKALANGAGVDRKKNGDVDVVDGESSRAEEGVAASVDDDGAWTDFDREKYYRMKLKKRYQHRKPRAYKKSRPSKRRKDLHKIVERLAERIASLPVPAIAKLANSRQEHAMVSPRKRILRELERVTLEDQNTKRRAKTVPALSTASYPPSPSPGPSHSHAHTHSYTHSHAAPARHNGSRRDPPASVAPSPTPTPTPTPTPARSVSSYSISSLLSMPEERRSPEAKRSPHSHRTSLRTESPSSVHSPDLSPSPDGYRYRPSALALGSPGPATSPQWAPPRTAGVREEWRELYVYPQFLPPPLYRAPPPLWMHYAGIPPGPWAPLSHPLLTDHIPKEEPTSDLPLNLSKH